MISIYISLACSIASGTSTKQYYYLVGVGHGMFDFCPVPRIDRLQVKPTAKRKDYHIEPTAGGHDLVDLSELSNIDAVCMETQRKNKEEPQQN